MESQGSLEVKEGSRSDRVRVCEMRTGPASVAFEDGDRAHKPRNVGSPQELEEAKTWILCCCCFRFLLLTDHLRPVIQMKLILHASGAWEIQDQDAGI